MDEDLKKKMRNNTSRCRSLSSVAGPTRGVMTNDKNGGLSDECIYCGTYTAGMIRDIPVCRACAKELETDPDLSSPVQSGGSDVE
jgi:hypothetical protein